VQESGDTTETVDRRFRGMRAVSKAMKGLLEDAEDKKQSQELEAMKMSIDTLITMTKEVMAEKEIRSSCAGSTKNREAPGGEPEIVVRQTGMEMPGMDQMQNKRDVLE